MRSDESCEVDDPIVKDCVNWLDEQREETVNSLDFMEIVSRTFPSEHFNI